MLDNLFIKLGYNRNNGLFVLSESKEAILETFPSRISRVLTEVIKPYAVFSLELTTIPKNMFSLSTIHLYCFMRIQAMKTMN